MNIINEINKKESVLGEKNEHYFKLKNIKKSKERSKNKNNIHLKSKVKKNSDVKINKIRNLSNLNDINNYIKTETQTIVAEKIKRNKKIKEHKKSKKSKSTLKNLIKKQEDNSKNKNNIDNNNTINNNINNNININNNNINNNEIDKKNNHTQNNKELELSPKKNRVISIITNPSPKRAKNTSTEKLVILDNLSHNIVKSKETISTYVDTISTEKNKAEENFEEIKNTIKAVFTPIPTVIKTSKNVKGRQPNLKDVEKAIKLRRQQYNEYLRSLNNRPKPKPKPKIYDINEVIFIQKMYKSYQVKDINQLVTRLKINLCVTELLCLIFNRVFKHARRRITFYMFKNYYHDPFTNIFTEVNFTDKLAMKLSDKYYNFNNFFKKFFK